MKKSLLTLCAIALLTGMSMASSQNIAVVDVSAVVEKSAQVQSLKNEQKNKAAQLEKWLKNAQADVNKQTTEENKQKLLKKYNAEFTQKREAMAKDYQTKLKAIDKNITATIETKAKAMGYDMVISKSMVISGGNDITAEIQKVVK